MVASMIVLLLLMLTLRVFESHAEAQWDIDKANFFGLLAGLCFIAIAVLGVILAWRYLP